MIKILLDQGLPLTTAHLMREHGWDVQHVSELGMSRAEDVAILRLAHQEQRVVVTLDADFHTLLALTGANGPSVVRIRMQGMKGAQTASLIERVLTLVSDDVTHGAMVTKSKHISFLSLDNTGS